MSSLWISLSFDSVLQTFQVPCVKLLNSDLRLLRVFEETMKVYKLSIFILCLLKQVG